MSTFCGKVLVKVACIARSWYILCRYILGQWHEMWQCEGDSATESATLWLHKKTVEVFKRFKYTQIELHQKLMCSQN